MTIEPDEWITITDASLILDCADSTVRLYIKRGELSSKKIRRLRVASTSKRRKYNVYRTVIVVNRSEVLAREEIALIADYPMKADEAAGRLGISAGRIAMLIREGRIDGRKIHGLWRTTGEAIEKYRRERLHRRPGADGPPLMVQLSDHNAPCSRCLCAACLQLGDCPLYADKEITGYRKSGAPRLANRCSDPRFCANEDGTTRRDSEKTPLELRPRLTYQIGLGWRRHDDELEHRAYDICQHFVRDNEFFVHRESVWESMFRRAGLASK